MSHLAHDQLIDHAEHALINPWLLALVLVVAGAAALSALWPRS